MTALHVVMTMSGCLTSCAMELTTTSKFMSLFARSRCSALTAVDRRTYKLHHLREQRDEHGARRDDGQAAATRRTRTCSGSRRERQRAPFPPRRNERNEEPFIEDRRAAPPKRQTKQITLASSGNAVTKLAVEAKVLALTRVSAANRWATTATQYVRRGRHDGSTVRGSRAVVASIPAPRSAAIEPRIPKAVTGRPGATRRRAMLPSAVRRREGRQA